MRPGSFASAIRMARPFGIGGGGAGGFGGAGGSSLLGPVICTSAAGLFGWLESETGRPSLIAKSGQYLATRKRIGSPSPNRLVQPPPAPFTGSACVTPEGPLTIAS